MAGVGDDGGDSARGCHRGGYARLNASFSAALGCSQSKEASIRSANDTECTHTHTGSIYTNIPLMRICQVVGSVCVRFSECSRVCGMRIISTIYHIAPQYVGLEHLYTHTRILATNPEPEHVLYEPTHPHTHTHFNNVPLSVSSVQLCIRRHRFWYSSRTSDVCGTAFVTVSHMCLVNAPTMAASRLKAATFR